MFTTPSKLALIASLFASGTYGQWNAIQHGQLFNFVPGLGACGYTNTSTQFVASVPSVFFHSFPGAGANPNDNPICTYDVTIIHNTTSVTAQIVDYCTQCADTSIGLSTSAFAKFADPSVGVVNNVSWAVTST